MPVMTLERLLEGLNAGRVRVACRRPGFDPWCYLISHAQKPPVNPGAAWKKQTKFINVDPACKSLKLFGSPRAMWGVGLLALPPVFGQASGFPSSIRQLVVCVPDMRGRKGAGEE